MFLLNLTKVKRKPWCHDFVCLKGCYTHWLEVTIGALRCPMLNTSRNAAQAFENKDIGTNFRSLDAFEIGTPHIGTVIPMYERTQTYPNTFLNVLIPSLDSPPPQILTHAASATSSKTMPRAWSKKNRNALDSASGTPIPTSLPTWRSPDMPKARTIFIYRVTKRNGDVRWPSSLSDGLGINSTVCTMNDDMPSNISRSCWCQNVLIKLTSIIVCQKKEVMVRRLTPRICELCMIDVWSQTLVATYSDCRCLPWLQLWRSYHVAASEWYTHLTSRTVNRQ